MPGTHSAKRFGVVGPTDLLPLSAPANALLLLLLLAADNKEARQAALADAAWRAVCAEYDEMRAAIRDPASRGTAFTQPWLDHPAIKLE